MKQILLLLTVIGLAGCMTRPPAPVSEGASNRIEPTRSGKLATKAEPARTAAPVVGAEVKPIAGGGPVVARSLDEAPATAVPPAPTVTSRNTDALKREPKGGKLPYSPEALAQLKVRDGQTVAPVAPSEKDKPPVTPAPAPAPAPAPVPAVAAIDWAWPVPGKIITNFNEGGGREVSRGIDIAGKIGDPVQVAATGKVIHIGSDIRGLGNFVVVKHGQEYISVYANNSRILVKQDQQVTRGQKIAELGNTDADQPKLHFEIRQQGKPTDPLRFLPPR